MHLVRETQDLVAARAYAYRQLDQAAGRADLKSADAARKAIAEIGARLEQADAALRQNFSGFADLANPRPLGLAETQSLLQANQALVLFLDLVEYSQIPEETLVFAVSKDKFKWLTIPYGARALPRRVKTLRCGLDGSSWNERESHDLCKELLGIEASEHSLPPFDAVQAHALYRGLFGGIEEVIKDKSLLIVPSGALTQFPFEVLVTSKLDKTLPRFEAYARAAWLGQRQSIKVLPSVASLRALSDAKATQAAEPFIGFGNPLLTGLDGSDRSAFSKQVCPDAKAHGKLQTARRSAGLHFPGAAWWMWRACAVSNHCRSWQMNSARRLKQLAFRGGGSMMPCISATARPSLS